MKTTYLKPVLDLTATGTKIKTVMKQKGFSARELSVLMDFPYVQTIYNWFSGKNMPTLDNLIVLAQILGVKMDDLIVTQQVEIEVGQEDAEELSAWKFLRLSFSGRTAVSKTANGCSIHPGRDRICSQVG